MSEKTIEVQHRRNFISEDRYGTTNTPQKLDRESRLKAQRAQAEYAMQLVSISRRNLTLSDSQ